MVAMESGGRRRSLPALPDDPTDDELAHDWTLTESDRAEVYRCRGDANKLRFAIQLCSLRTYGRFVTALVVPVRIANHLAKQLDLPPVLFVEPSSRPATDHQHHERIRDYLGFKPFDGKMSLRLEEKLVQLATQEIVPGQLVQQAEDILRGWRVVLPAQSTLVRIATSASTQAQTEIFQRLANRLDPEQCRAIDDLLEVSPDDHRSTVFTLREYPPEASPVAIMAYVERFRLLRSLRVERIDVHGVNPELVRHLAQLTRKYDAAHIRRFGAEKRHSMMACFLSDVYKSVQDHIVDMNHQFLTGMSRRARNSFERRQKQLRRQVKIGLDTVLRAVEFVLDSGQSGGTTLELLHEKIDETQLRQAVETCRDFQRVQEQGYLDELRARHHQLKRYLLDFLELPFEAEPGSEGLLAAVELTRGHLARKRKTLPRDAPMNFVPAGWRKGVMKDGKIDQQLWEIALAFAMRDALRSGDLYLPGSRHHVSFWNLVYDHQRWVDERDAAYVRLGLPSEPERSLVRLGKEFDDAAHRLAKGLEDNDFARIQDGGLKLKRRDAVETPDGVRELRRLIHTQLSGLRIEDLLLKIDSWCHFTRELRPLGGYTARSENIYPALLAALVAHGTNLGITTMAQSTDGISLEMLQHVTRWFFRNETLKAANTVLVNYHHGLSLSSVWGGGAVSSSDGQRFGIEASSLLASFYPRYFGYYERALTVYTHVSDQYSVFASRVISCSPREAIYVLDGLLENDTVLLPRQHITDTHGFTEHLFGLCYLLGFSFMPRLKDLKNQQLYKLSRADSYGPLDPLFREAVDTNLIREQWDQLVRVAASLRNRTAPAHLVVERLAASSPSDRLAKALTALGRVVKTVYILRYLHDEELRAQVQLQLNRTESRNQLARRLFFANQGTFRTGDYEEIMNKVSALSLLSNAVLVDNTVRYAEIIDALRKAGAEVDLDELKYVSPLAHAHVIPSGSYDFAAAFDSAA